MASVSRRSMLKMAGGTALGLGLPGRVLAVFEDGSIVVQDHRVPAEKGLSAEWKKALYDRGMKEVWSGAALDSIGMPVGGIATGQMYLCGDGTLGCWEIFNHHEFQSYGLTSYAKREVPHPVQFGLVVEAGGKAFPMNKRGFQSVSFKGEHPVATVTYRDPECPVGVVSEVYSPFIPMNAADSALPTTVFDVHFTNPTDHDIDVSCYGFLENACSRSAAKNPGDRKRHTKAVVEPGLTMMVHSSDPGVDEFADDAANPRASQLLADFESDDYAGWTIDGEAFGAGPAKGTLPDQNPVTGFVGKGLVNTFNKGDSTKGRLTSPEFTIDRKFINFKIAGGNQPGRECINLLVDGAVVRTSTGLNDERLFWETWNVENLSGRKAKIEIVDDATGGWSHVNIDQIEQSDKVRSRDDLRRRHGDPNGDTGSMALAVISSGKADSRADYGLGGDFVGLVRADKFTVPAKGEVIKTFVLAWHFPHHSRGRNYANKFADAEAVARYVAAMHPSLSHGTKLWRDTYYDSSLPFWLLDRLHSTIGNLATGTTEWWGNGRFWAWEGVVCCTGTCTHVWNYEHALARLFPEIERNIRTRQDYGEAFDEATGLVGFRSDRQYAADGQAGTVLKAYREHLTSPDLTFLRQHWPKIKKSLEFLINRDANADGVLEDAQPNTYDIDFYGANTFVGSLYLAALRAGEEMAKDMSDLPFVTKCQTLFVKGSEKTVAQLWNGEFFIQDVDQNVYKEFQYGPGCLADQLFGQGWAHQVGLGHIYPKDKVVTGLKSVWKYNWAPDVKAQNERWAPERPFAVPGEAGLFICTWPNGGREAEPVRYRDEVWTGIEYQVAGNMVWEGMVEEGLSICKAVHDRYHPVKRNPYNEVECSDHYARAMASWGVFTALSGFSYHGPRGRIGFAPRMKPEDFKSAFTAAEGWGTFTQKVSKDRHRSEIKIVMGQVQLKEVFLESKVTGTVSVTTEGRSLEFVAARSTSEPEKLTIILNRTLVLLMGQSVTVEIG